MDTTEPLYTLWCEKGCPPTPTQCDVVGLGITHYNPCGYTYGV